MKDDERLTKRRMVFDVLEEVFLGELRDAEGRSSMVKLAELKRSYFIEMKNRIEEEIDDAVRLHPEFEMELYDWLCSFFRWCMTEAGSVIFPGNRDVVLFWRKKDFYYLKTERVFRSMEFEYKGYRFRFDASEVEGKRGNERREVGFEFKGMDGDVIVFKVLYQETNGGFSIDRILEDLVRMGVDVSERQLKHVFRIYKKHAREVDFFLCKSPREFWRERFSLWLYQNLFADCERAVERMHLIKLVRRVVFRVIDLIAQFEERLVEIWNRPRAVLTASYVVSLNRIEEKGGMYVIEKLMKHPGWKEQVREWIALGVLRKEPDDLLYSDLLGKRLKREYRFLPIDTRYFKDMEGEIISLFGSVEDELDGWLIKSENYQALKTILPKFKGKVQTIYIDPPFNREREADYLYTVRFVDSTWATMLENRLSLARDFLKDTGAIFVRCDCSGNWIVRPLMDEIFGRENFKNELIIRRKRQAMGSSTKFEVENEYIYFYAVSEKVLRKDVYARRDMGKVMRTAFLKQGERRPRERVFIGKVLYPPENQHFMLNQEKVNKLLEEHYLRLRCVKCGARYYYDPGDSGENFRRKVDLSSFKYNDLTNRKVFGVSKLERCLSCGHDDFRVEYLPSEMRKLGNIWLDVPSYSDSHGFATENSEAIVKLVIECSSEEGDLVMDFFMGSGTTCAAAHKMGRKWIGIEIGEHFYTVALPRMKKVLAYDETGISSDKDVKKRYNRDCAGGFFVYCELEQFEDLLETIKV